MHLISLNKIFYDIIYVHAHCLSTREVSLNTMIEQRMQAGCNLTMVTLKCAGLLVYVFIGVLRVIDSQGH